MKRFLSIFLTIAVMVTMLAMPTSADNLPTVTVASVEEATPIGAEVKLEVSVANNPGFTNFDWLVKYDTDRLELKAFEYTYEVVVPGFGTFEQSYALRDFEAKANNISTGEIAVGNTTALTTADATLFSLVFVVKANALSGEAKVSIVSENIKNNGVAVGFNYVGGTVNVDGIDCDEGHDYGEWQTETEPTCDEEGLKYRICKRKGCGHKDTEEILELGHAYGDFVFADEENHKQICANDSDHVVIDEHEFDENQYCPICRYQGEATGDTTGGTGENTGGTGETTGGTGETTGGTGETTGGTGETTGGTGETTGGTGETTGGTGETTGGTGETTGGTGETTGGTGETTGGTGETTGGTGETTGGTGETTGGTGETTGGTGETTGGTGETTGGTGETTGGTGETTGGTGETTGGTGETTGGTGETTGGTGETTGGTGETTGGTGETTGGTTTIGGYRGVTYTVRFETNGGGSIASQGVKSKKLVVKPKDPTKEGYIFDGWYLDKGLTQLYNFNTPVTKSFTLYAKWNEISEEPISSSFIDVNETDWFYNAVKFAYDKKLMNGISTTEFAPNSTVTRAELVTVIYRLEGEPATNKGIPYSDVNMGTYYADAVSWSHQNEIIKGISETEFAPNINITREQIATIIYRYVQHKGYDLSVVKSTDLLSYTDADEISEYAIDAMKYAVGSGLMKGRTNTSLSPKGYATRAELAQIFYNFFN